MARLGNIQKWCEDEVLSQRPLEMGGGGGNMSSVEHQLYARHGVYFHIYGRKRLFSKLLRLNLSQITLKFDFKEQNDRKRILQVKRSSKETLLNKNCIFQTFILCKYTL